YRPSGTMFHPNSVGLYFAVLLPFAAAFAGARTLPISRRLFCLGATISLCVGLFFTNSRGALLASAVMLAYLAWHAGYRRLLLLGAAGLGVVGLFLLLSPDRGRFWNFLMYIARVR